MRWKPPVTQSVFSLVAAGVFPQDEDEDEPDSSEDELFNQKKDKKKRKRKGAEEGTLAKKHKESFAAKLAVLPQKTACEVGEKPSEANQINASSTSADDGESQAQDDELGLQRQVKANSKDKKRKGKKPKSDIPDVGEEAAPQSLLISKDMNKELILVDEGVKRHPIPKTVAEDKGGKEQTTTLSSNGKKHKKKWAGKQISECASDILENSQHLEEFSDHTPLKNKKKKSVLAGEESIRGVEVKMSREAEVPLKRCTNKRPADPSRALPLQMYPSEDQTNSATCVLRKKTKHKKKMIMKMRADAKIVNSLLEKTCADVQAEYVSSHPPAAVVITTGCQSSNTTAPLLMNKKSKKLKSKGKTRETASCGDVDMSSDCTDNKINCIEALNADAVKHSKLRSTKKQKKKKCISSQEQEFGVDMEQSVDALCAAQTNAVKRSSSTPTPLQKKKTQKRKEQLAVCLTGELNMGVQPTKDNCITKEHEDVEWSTTVIPKKKLKMKKGLQEANFISFEGKMTPPNPLFCKTKPKGWSTPLSSIKAFHTQQSETKKVTFGLKNNKTTEFRKTDWSLLVSPVGSSRVAFDPKKMPVSSMLKSPALSPALSPVVSVKKTVSRKRPTAADFF
ncbi:hypothetical protein P4O66_008053 [Electrophorus voltai]|uniref:Uncharacterized protein n=1 Tax=Electrophorus voltai TaxID=2609070 RepID=A0AAD9DYI7_9TELE|nr:hypothetical protein P4O66_008053 [Electrophorus voltai]